MMDSKLCTYAQNPLSGLVVLKYMLLHIIENSS